MCSREGVINVLRRTVRDRTQRLEEVRKQKVLIDRSIAMMEQDQIRDIARLKELENDGK